MPYLGRFGEAGLVKEDTLGTAKVPARFRRFIPPFNFSLDIAQLLGKGVQGVADEVLRTAQGKAQLKGGKIKSELDLLEVGDDLMAAFGVDTVTEVASFIVVDSGAGQNNLLDMNIDGHTNIVVTIAAGTYKAGQTQADTGTLCALLYAGIHAAEPTQAYTVAFTRSATGGTFTITCTTALGTLNLPFKTGASNAKSIGNLLGYASGSSGTDLTGALFYTGTSVVAVYSHAFSRVQSAVLPSYTWWQYSGLDYPQFAGCMCSKLEFNAKVGEFVECDGDWIGLKYDATGVTHSPSYSALNPIKFSMCVPSIGGAPSANYDDVKITIDNQIAVEHAVTSSIYGTKIYSKGLKIAANLSLMVEDVTEWAKFVAGNDSALSLAMTSTDMIKGAIPYSLTLSIPAINYSAAPRQLPNGLIKIAFTAVGVYGGSYTMLPTLINGYGLSY